MEWTPRLNCARGAVDLAARLGGVLQYSHDAAGEHEIFVLHLPADSRAPEPARRSFVCYRDAAESDSKSLRRSRVPKPSALLPQPSRICFAIGSSPRELPDARAGPALHRHSPGWKAGKHPPV